jgi:hypothetical protein
MGKMGEIAADLSALDMTFDLSRFMRENRVIRISDNGAGFSVYMRGDILGTGETVGEAFDNAARQRRLAA